MNLLLTGRVVDGNGLPLEAISEADMAMLAERVRMALTVQPLGSAQVRLELDAVQAASRVTSIGFLGGNQLFEVRS